MLIGAPDSDAELLYMRALEVAEQWFDHYHISQNRRHLTTALACAAISRECYQIVAEERIRRNLGTDWESPAQTELAARVSLLARTLSVLVRD